MRLRWLIVLGLTGLAALSAVTWWPGGALAVGIPNVPHPLEGRNACTTCHQPGGSGIGATGGLGMPDNHAGRENGSCTGCHLVSRGKPGAQASPTVTAAAGGTVPPATAANAPSIPHETAGRGACNLCHQAGGSGVGAPGGLGMPANHQGRTDATCTGCHPPASLAQPAQPTKTAQPSQPTQTTQPAKPGPTATTAAANTTGAAGATPAPKPAGTALPSTEVAAAVGATGLPNAGEFEDRLTLVGVFLSGGAGLLFIGYSLRRLLTTK